MPTPQQVNDLVDYLLQNGYQAPRRYMVRETQESAYFYPRYASAETDDTQIPQITCDRGADQEKLARFLFRCSIGADGTTTVYAQIHPEEIPEHMKEIFAADVGGVSIHIRNVLYPEFTGRNNIKYGKSGHGDKWNLKRSNVNGIVPGDVKRWRPDGWKDHRIGTLRRGCFSMNPVSLDVGPVSLSRPNVEIGAQISINKEPGQETAPIKVATKNQPRKKSDPFYGFGKRGKNADKFSLRMGNDYIGEFQADEHGISAAFEARRSYCRVNNWSVIPSNPTMLQIHLWLERK